MVSSGAGAHDRIGHPVLARENTRRGLSGASAKTSTGSWHRSSKHSMSLITTPLVTAPASNAHAVQDPASEHRRNVSQGNSPEASGAEEKEIPAYGPASTTPGFAFSVVLEVLWVAKPVPDASGGINSQVRPLSVRGNIPHDNAEVDGSIPSSPPSSSDVPAGQCWFRDRRSRRLEPQQTAPCQSIWHVRGTLLTAGNGQDPRRAGRCPPDRHRRD